jgi:hypothetical protein
MGGFCVHAWPSEAKADHKLQLYGTTGSRALPVRVMNR